MNIHATTFYEVLRQSIDRTPRLRVVKGKLSRVVGGEVVAVFQANSFPRPKPRMFAGMKAMIENPAGSVRSGTDKNGHKWSVTMKHDYGYLSRIHGSDGEGLDVFLGPDEKADAVHVVHQNDPTTGHYDEDKVMMGFPSAEAAKAGYLANYDRPDFFRSITSIPLDTFKKHCAEKGYFKWKRKPGNAHAAMFSADESEQSSGGHWITIGSKEGEDGKNHGGVHVMIGGSGKIEKGPSKMTGKTVDQVKKDKKPTIHDLIAKSREGRKAKRDMDAERDLDHAERMQPMDRLTGHQLREVARRAGVSTDDKEGMGQVYQKLHDQERKAPGSVSQHFEPVEQESAAKPVLTKGPAAYEVKHPDGKVEGFAKKDQAVEHAKAHGGTGKVEKPAQDKSGAAIIRAMDGQKPEQKKVEPPSLPEHAQGVDSSILEDMPHKELTHEQVYNDLASRFGDQGELDEKAMKTAEKATWPSAVIASRLGIPQSRVGELAKEGVFTQVNPNLYQLNRPAGVEPPQKRNDKTPSEFTKSGILKTLTERYQNENPVHDEGQYTDQEAEVMNRHGSKTFYRGSKYAEDVKQELASRGIPATAVQWTDNPSNAGGEDAASELGDKYYDILEDQFGSPSRRALEYARKQGGEMGFLAGIHDSYVEGEGASARKAKATKLEKEGKHKQAEQARQAASESVVGKPKQEVDRGNLKLGDEFEINGAPVRIEEEDEGELVAKDHGTIPDTPVDQLPDKIPVDKGTMKNVPPKEAEIGEGDPFADVPQAGEGGGKPPEEPPVATAGGSSEEPDRTHLHAIEDRLFREKQRLAQAKNARERELRQVWVTQAEKELANERESLGLSPEEAEKPISDDELLALLADSSSPEPEKTARPDAPVDNNRQLGMFTKDASGNPVEIGQRAGQGDLFGKAKPVAEPVKEPAQERIGSASANDPKHTAEMFPDRHSEDDVRNAMLAEGVLPEQADKSIQTLKEANHATPEGQRRENDQPEHSGTGEGGARAEAGGGDRNAGGGEAKAAYEMTPKEFEDAVVARTNELAKQNPRQYGGKRGMVPALGQARIDVLGKENRMLSHRQVVENAHKSGKSIPPSVLTHFPHLKPVSQQTQKEYNDIYNSKISGGPNPMPSANVPYPVRPGKTWGEISKEADENRERHVGGVVRSDPNAAREAFVKQKVKAAKANTWAIDPKGRKKYLEDVADAARKEFDKNGPVQFAAYSTADAFFANLQSHIGA